MKLTIDVPKGEHCGNCKLWSYVCGGHEGFCNYYEKDLADAQCQQGEDAFFEKCPQCLEACEREEAE